MSNFDEILFLFREEMRTVVSECSTGRQRKVDEGRDVPFQIGLERVQENVNVHKRGMDCM